ncbi:hypothetical protein Tco_1543814 [Tanacetum coccineum]
MVDIPDDIDLVDYDEEDPVEDPVEDPEEDPEEDPKEDPEEDVDIELVDDAEFSIPVIRALRIPLVSSLVAKKKTQLNLL